MRALEIAVMSGLGPALAVFAIMWHFMIQVVVHDSAWVNLVRGIRAWPRFAWFSAVTGLLQAWGGAWMHSIELITLGMGIFALGLAWCTREGQRLGGETTHDHATQPDPRSTTH